MTREWLVFVLILAAAVGERSVIPYFSLADATISIMAIAVAGLFLLGYYDPSLKVAVLGGLFLDLSGPAPFGVHVATLSILWGVLYFFSRYRLITPRAVVVSIVMIITGVIAAASNLFAAPSALPVIASAFLHALVGTAAFPLLKRMFPPAEKIRA